jgi:50S ribosomal protein L16 3-hydroxylase
LTALLDFDAAHFLREDWQRRPRILRGAVPGFANPLGPDELAGLALEDDIESRLVETRAGGWHFEAGPFSGDSFERDNPWTLLVQSVDQYIPGVAELRSLVDFLPSWRLDDIMVSYASDGGSVGPHYDNYDVFLLQGLGRRRWRIGQHCESSEPLLAHPQLRILSDFRQVDEYILEPGDILYLPPRIAHWGIAEGDCMTYSIGFRAPRLNDMLSRWLDQALEQIDPELFYRDPPLGEPVRPGEIDAAALECARRQLQGAIANLPPGDDWFGELVTEPRDGACIAGLDVVDMPASVRLAPGARLAWRPAQHGAIVYANGEALHTSGDFASVAQALCALEVVSLDYCDDAQRELLQRLYTRGCLDNA